MIQDFDPQYRRLKRRYKKNKNVETFNELTQRIKYFKTRKNLHKEIIKSLKKSKTKLAEDTIKDSIKILMLIDKQMQIFELQKEADYYANEL